MRTGKAIGTVLSVVVLLTGTSDRAGSGPGVAGEPRRIEVAPGVHLFITPPYSDVGLDGNSVAIIADSGVLVFDANGTPWAASRVLAQIRGLTSAPVRYLVYSHWHWDHWYGAQVYREAYPGLTIIAHEASRRLMAGPAIEFNRPGLEDGLPGYLQYLEHQAAAAESAGSAEAAAARQHANEARFFLEQKRSVRHLLPDLTFTDSLTIHLGARRIQLLHYDRAVTPGDALLFLPDQKLLVTGDLLVNPISFALGSYPAGWIRTLEWVRRLDARIIVPGHGEPLRDSRLLDLHLGILRRLRDIGRNAKASGLDVEAARARAMRELGTEMIQLTGDRPELNQQFELYLVDWFLHRVYQELDGPLGNDIAPIPSHPE